MINESLSLKILKRLVKGKPLDGLGLGSNDGRVDLGGLALPAPTTVRRFPFAGFLIAATERSGIIKGRKWQNLDFSGSALNGLRLFGCELSNCRLDHCQLQDWRVWATKFRDCSFKGANLKGSMLGGVQDGKRNIFSSVDFSNADLRETIYKAAAFEGCIFRHAKLEKIDFQTSTFTDCVFEGELRDVMFYRTGFQGEAFPVNEMINVDLGRTKLHDVGFRGLTLERVKLPEDSDHIMIKNVVATLDKLIVALKLQEDTVAKKLAAFLSIDRKWSPPAQTQTVINVQDLRETVGAQGLNRLRELLRQCGP